MERYIHSICKIDSQWELLYASGNSNQGSVRGEVGWEVGGRFEREVIYVYL